MPHQLIIHTAATVPLSVILQQIKTMARQLGDSTAEEVIVHLSVALPEHTVKIEINYNYAKGFTKEELTIK